MPHLSKVSASLFVGLIDGLIRRLLDPQGVKDGAHIDVHQASHQGIYRLVTASVALSHNNLRMQRALNQLCHVHAHD